MKILAVMGTRPEGIKLAPLIVELRQRANIDFRVVTTGQHRELMDQVQPLQEAWQHRMDALPDGRPPGARLRQVRWMLEDYRVSLWAQQLGTAQPVSDTRIRKALG